MKNKLVLAIALLASTIASAQSDSTRKGHFVFSADILNYSAGSVNELYKDEVGFNNYITNTEEQHYSIMSVAFNLSAGYFVSNRVCMGLNFGNPYINIIQYYTYNGYSNTIFSSLMPSSFFVRYYLNKNDDNVASFFLEGGVGGSYNSITFGSSGTPQAIANVNGDINVAISLHAVKHLDILVKAGFLFNYYYFGNSGYEQDNIQSISSPAFVSSLGLQYML